MKTLGEPERLELAKAWRRAVVRAMGFKFRPSVKRGVDIRGRKAAHGYLSKMGLEIHAITKKGRKDGSRSPWQIAHGAAAGDRQDVALWQHYCRAMHGARQLTWTRGTKERFGLTDRKDAQLSSEEREQGSVSTLLCQWTGERWDRQRHRPGWYARVLRAAYSATPLTELEKLEGARLVGPRGIVRAPHTGPPRSLFPPDGSAQHDDRKAGRRQVTAALRS
jgi:hypothetical protein